MSTLLRRSGDIIAAFFFLGVVSLTSIYFLAHSHKRAAVEVCQLIRENFYRRDEPAVQAVLAHCEKDSKHDLFVWSRSEVVQQINRRLSEIRVSHLSVFAPSESHALWDNESIDTGVRARMIEGEVVVYEIIKESGGATAGIKQGDAILSINGADSPANANDAQTEAGMWRIVRRGENLDLKVTATDLTDDLHPTLSSLNKDVGLLKIPSFLPGYFAKQQWVKLAQGFSRYREIIIDLRGNNGGGFPAMLRALSAFHCHEDIVGVIHAAGEGKTADLADDDSAELQVKTLHDNGSITLRTFSGYGCFSGPVTVLIDSDTASTAEIFAENFTGGAGRAKSRVWGQPSSGHVVMARWFPISNFGSDEYSVSIPIAGYQSINENVIEGRGLIPARELHYDLARALHGTDSWLDDVLSDLSRNVSR